jgi:lipoprotein-anchoring transpeptidase ErfK/SrfK
MAMHFGVILRRAPYCAAARFVVPSALMYGNAAAFVLVTALLAAGASAQSQAPQPPDGTRADNAAAARAAQRRYREVLAVQTVLDRHNLSGGRIDGTIGSRTRAALEVWQAAHGLPVTGRLDDATKSSVLRNGSDLLTRHRVTAEEHADLSVVPTSWAEKATMAHMGYGTILEMLAEKYHASENALLTLNPDAAWPDPPPGATIVVPNPFPAAKPKAASLAISLGGKWIRAYDAAGNVLAHFPCSIAADKTKRPVGELTVVVAARDPNYTFNPEVFPEEPESARLQGRKLIIAPGPNNPVGVAWIGLSLAGYGMHGTPRPEDIGKTESHGCFRLANWNASKLLDMVRADLPVRIEE